MDLLPLDGAALLLRRRRLPEENPVEQGARVTEPTQLNMLSEIPPVFVCKIDESAGQREDHENTQLTELPGDTFEEIFQR